MNIDVQVEHLEATVRELQDIHEDLKKAATCNGSFSMFFQRQTANASDLPQSGNMDVGILGTGGKGGLWNQLVEVGEF